MAALPLENGNDVGIGLIKAGRNHDLHVDRNRSGRDQQRGDTGQHGQPSSERSWFHEASPVCEIHWTRLHCGFQVSCAGDVTPSTERPRPLTVARLLRRATFRQRALPAFLRAPTGTASFLSCAISSCSHLRNSASFAEFVVLAG